MIQLVLDASLAVAYLLLAVAFYMVNGELQSLGCVPGLPFATIFQRHGVAIFHLQMTSSGPEQEAHAVHGGVSGPAQVNSARLKQTARTPTQAAAWGP